MFKLLAIRPLEGCAPHIQKCLKTGMMYYFCNDYIIEPGSHIRRRSKNIKPLKEDFFTVVSKSNYSEDNSSKEKSPKEKSPKVSVSAIVGMNGDGKSTLVELMMRLINNCAISYELCASSDNIKGENDTKTEPHYNLRRVENAKAELYYMIDNLVYRMAEEKDQEETRIWKVSELNPFNEKGEELMRWEIDSTEIQKVEDDPKGFFFTIVSNYSHYANNIYDYEKEWEIRGGEKDDDEKCWLHYIFHKNDGYLTPITLHPYRYKGNIDINVEKDLSKQRLLSLFLNADNPSENPLSFRRVNGKDANILKLMEITESKLQQKTIVDFFQAAGQEKRFDNLINKIDNVYKRIGETVLKFESIQDWYDKQEEYKNLADFILPSYFIGPIKQIIEQDTDFVVFVNEVVDWLKILDNPRSNNSRDIWSVENSYHKLNNRIKDCMMVILNNNAALAYSNRSDYDKALECYYNVIGEFDNKSWKFDILDVATTYNNIGNVHYNKGEYVDALGFYKRAMEIRENELGKDDLDTAMTYNNIAHVYEDMFEFNEALGYYEKAREIREAKLGENDPYTLSIYVNLANVYGKLGIHDKELEYNKKTELMKKPRTMNSKTNVHLDKDVLFELDMEILHVSKDIKDKALFESKYKKIFQEINATQLGRLDTIYRIMKWFNIDWRIVT